MEHIDEIAQMMVEEGGQITPTTFNPAFTNSGHLTYSDGNQTVETDQTGAFNGTLTIYHAETLLGHWYWEFTPNVATSFFYIFGGHEFVAPPNLNNAWWNDPDSFMYISDGRVFVDGVVVDTYGSFGVGDVIGFRMDHGALYLRVNGVWQNSGDPVATGIDFDMYVATTLGFKDDAVTINCGSGPWADPIPAGATGFGAPI